jgi:hypothetical protein
MANLSGNKPWSEMDLSNLKRALARGYPIELIACYLMRDAEEVRQKREAVLAAAQPDCPGDLQAFRPTRRLPSWKTAA